jgi:hypothetical protein
MPASTLNRLAVAAAMALACLSAHAATVSFGGYTWDVRTGGGGPGPNNWSAGNVFVDADGLHLKISHVNGSWSCAEVTMTRSLGFGEYQWEVTGRPDLFDRNVVLGLFNYPSSSAIGPDGTNEIDIEFAQWGDANNQNRLNWTVYPPALGPKPTHKEVPMTLTGDATTHRFDWTSAGVNYHSFYGYQDSGNANPMAKWNDAPTKPLKRIPQTPIPVHMNLWLVDGNAPADGQPVEVVIRSFKFTPH